MNAVYICMENEGAMEGRVKKQELFYMGLNEVIERREK